MSRSEPNLGDGLYDPRAVANLILDVIHRPITHLSLQKLLYFVHGAYLLRKKKALITGYFEAWNHGPVHPGVYNAFKEFGPNPITSRALKKDLRTGVLEGIRTPDDVELRTITEKVVRSLGSLSAGQLVKLSHAQGGAWDLVFVRSKSEHMLGLRISNELIRDRYKNHWFSAEKLEIVDEPSEDTPLAYHRLG